MENPVERLISILSKNCSSEIESVVQAGNDKNSISITFTNGEVLVLTAEEEKVGNPDSTNFI